MSSSSFTMSLLSLSCLYRSPLLALLALPCPLLSWPLLRLPSSLPAMLSPSCLYCPTCPAYVTHTWYKTLGEAQGLTTTSKVRLRRQLAGFLAPKTRQEAGRGEEALGGLGGPEGGPGVGFLSRGAGSSAGPTTPSLHSPPSKPHLTPHL